VAENGGELSRPRAPGRRWLRHGVRFALVVLITWALLRAFGIRLAELDWRELAAWRPAVAPLVASTFLLIAVYLGHALLWRRILTDLTGRRAGLAVALRIYFLSNLGRYLPGKVWQLAGMALLAERAGLPGVAAGAAAVLGQIVLLLTGAVFLVVLVPGWAGSLPALLTALGLAALTGVGLRLLAGPLGRRLRARMKGRFAARLAPALELASGVRPLHALRWSLGYAAGWIVLGVAFVLFASAFVPQAAAAPGHLAGTVAAAYLGGYLAFFAPAGAGVREGVMGLLLAQVMPAEAALVIAVASRVWFTAAEAAVLAMLPMLPGPRAGSYERNSDAS
jgi:glycosyltransferase 2 family protein